MVASGVSKVTTLTLTAGVTLEKAGAAPVVGPDH
jgi:hypothetical protein